MSDNDKFLQEYFTDLGVALGFPKNNSLSLFDLPSMTLFYRFFCGQHEISSESKMDCKKSRIFLWSDSNEKQLKKVPISPLFERTSFLMNFLKYL